MVSDLVMTMFGAVLIGLVIAVQVLGLTLLAWITWHALRPYLRRLARVLRGGKGHAKKT